MDANLAEIAQKAGVSLATASRALNGKGGVKAETRERVLAVAQELRYTVSMAARSLATARTETICYVVHQRHVPLDIDPFYSIIMHGIEAELSRQGYHLLLTTISDEQFKADGMFKPVAERRVDGVILAGPDIAPSFILALKQAEVPLVLVDNTLTAATVDAINSDDILGGKQATEHLIAHGHQTIVALLGPDDWASSSQRGRGYRRAMVAANLTPYLFHAHDTTFDTGKQLMSEALDAVPNLTAVFAANDAIALGAMRTLSQRGRHVPADIAIIGFDDTSLSALSTPALSTVKVFKHEIGRLAAHRMLDILSEESTPPVQMLVATELIPRTSCGCSWE
ncbi:LacI family transcriptional regulator [Ktedonosporobacter rubrisoli]|uniref:LacI family transcriptional regulator n=1 Tax=Ktedonosporobacter rubrisoli TaxID=2509675 RepID=A0A4P6JPC1_KTERU|nr:LacI family DNA-binding transcriptional regulator [Ktedonosporobacter rubrisoli]QBD77115.1 LacI family transcriptional regulator [Ktedonosporobacter rubrisoli]